MYRSAYLKIIKKGEQNNLLAYNSLYTALYIYIYH